jgi:polyhydroxyalkanoate synthase
MAVVKSGHIQSFVNPAAKARYDYWEGPSASRDPDQWLAGATEHHGSWWPQWLEWLIARSGTEKAPGSALGNKKYPPLGPAPGTYVHQ